MADERNRNNDNANIAEDEELVLLCHEVFEKQNIHDATNNDHWDEQEDYNDTDSMNKEDNLETQHENSTNDSNCDDYNNVYNSEDKHIKDVFVNNDVSIGFSDEVKRKLLLNDVALIHILESEVNEESGEEVESPDENETHNVDMD